jgi:diguanylate cyclase (GGDEF)-like protein/PAS domain S-box-containing protein
MSFRRMVARLGVTRSTLVFTAFCVLVSSGIYLMAASLANQVRAIGIFVSLITPMLVAPPLCIILLRIARSLSLAEQEVRKARGELERRVAERTEELRRANEQLRKEIDERKSAEQGLRDSENRFRQLSESSLSGICIIQDGRFRYVNPAMAAILGRLPEELTGREALTIAHPEDSSLLGDHLRRVREGAHESGENVFRALSPSGDTVYLEMRATPIDFADSPAVMGNVLDITERKRIEEALRRHQENLEELIKERTAALEREIAEHKAAEKALKQSEQKYRAIFEQAGEGIFQTTPDGRCLSVNPALARMFGYDSPEDAIADITDLERRIYANPADRERLSQLLAENGTVEAYEVEALRKDGKKIWISINAHTVLDEKGRTICYEGTNQNITRRKEAEARLRESEERYRVVIEHSNDGISVIREGRHFFVNRKFLDMFGFDRPDEIVGDDICRIVHGDDQNMVRAHALRRNLGEPAPSQYEFKGVRKDGSIIFVEASVATANYGGEPASLAFLRDVTERKQMEEKLHAISIIDELTGLYNRRGFFTLCTQQMKLAERNRNNMELFFIDLDGLKGINDTWGHKEGDASLAGIAAILRQTFRETDIIGRMGGDEFAVLAINTTDRSREYLLSRLQETLDNHNGEEARKVRLSLSAGAVTYDPGNPAVLDELLTTADTLMYEEKRRKQHPVSP